MKKIKVGIVNYLNTAPLIYGLQNNSVKDDIELIPDYPANLAIGLQKGEIDLGLVPVAVIPELNNACIVGDYCIGSDGPVASVCIFSEVPINEIKKVYLDYQSRTSVELARILLKDFWKIDAEFLPASEDYQSFITGTTAGLVIGDRSFEQRAISPYVYDLGEAWKKFTGLPFVFAAWVSNRHLDEDFIKRFNEANAYGLAHLKEVIALHPYSLFNLEEYYNHYISYPLDAEKKKGLAKFIEYLAI